MNDLSRLGDFGMIAIMFIFKSDFTLQFLVY